MPGKDSITPSPPASRKWRLRDKAREWAAAFPVTYIMLCASQSACQACTMSSLIYVRMLGYAVTIVMHTVNTVSMALVLHEDEVKELFKDPTIKFFNDNQARYFTCWTFFLQVVYACIGLTCDCLTLKNSYKEDYQLNKHLRRLRDTLFSAIQWPSTLLVSSLFWGLYNFDRELILPPKLDRVLSWTSNHVIHTAIVPVVLWELLTRPRTEPRSHWRNIAHIVFHFLLYFSVVFHTYFTTGEWIYPVFKEIWGTILFPLFMSSIFLIILFYYYIQWPLTRLIHGTGDRKKRKIQ